MTLEVQVCKHGKIILAHRDTYGFPISTSSEEAAHLYREGVILMHSLWPGAAEKLDAAIEADRDFALAHAARARLHAIHAEPAEARDRIAVAQSLAGNSKTERENSHIGVLAHAVTGQSGLALGRALAHAETWPRDTVILSLLLGAFGLYAFSGRASHNQAKADLCARHAAQFADNDWWFLTYHGWSLAENGEVARGRAMLERAVELRRANANAVHALAHAMFEGGAGDDAETLIASWLPDYDRKGVLHGHIAWHAALTALERGDAERALAVYLESVQPPVSHGMPINVVSDAASFLWRLDIYGHGVPDGLWQDAASYAKRVFPRPGHGFVDAHMALTEAATGDRERLEARIAALEEMIAAAKYPAGQVVPALGRAAMAFASEHYAACATLLEPFAADVARIGGSNAQREVIEDTLLAALMRSGQTQKARTLLDSRLHRRPSPRDARWRVGLGV